MKDNKTEELIKSCSKDLFFNKGKLNASTQEVADNAGVKRTLVNYYFGSKQKLFDLVFEELRFTFKMLLHNAVSGTASVYDKVSTLIQHCSDFIKEYPYFNIFMITEINKVGDNKTEKMKKYHFPELDIFFSEIEKEMEDGKIPKMNPLNFYINIFALLSYPIIMRPYYEQIFDVTKKEMNELYTSRKEVILKLIFQHTQQQQ
ncbi:MAG: TetR/AcrR family transcriptional regulator [Taibaiella sp.]|nr:TetR/AcrR family transcriptional regulator [Taibaiella sp.]